MSQVYVRLFSRFTEALSYSHELHQKQTRKGTDIPYVSHLLAVASLVVEAGGSEEQAIAALLHDAVEDQGGAKTLHEIQRRFGDEVAAIVDHCSDTDEIPKPPWRDRKERYISGLQEAPEEMILVSIADKLHNARCILIDYREHGDRLWKRFNGGKEGTLWYYRALTDAYQNRTDIPILSLLDETVRELERRVETEGHGAPLGDATATSNSAVGEEETDAP